MSFRAAAIADAPFFLWADYSRLNIIYQPSAAIAAKYIDLLFPKAVPQSATWTAQDRSVIKTSLSPWSGSPFVMLHNLGIFLMAVGIGWEE